MFSVKRCFPIVGAELKSAGSCYEALVLLGSKNGVWALYMKLLLK